MTDQEYTDALKECLRDLKESVKRVKTLLGVVQPLKSASDIESKRPKSHSNTKRKPQCQQI